MITPVCTSTTRPPESGSTCNSYKDGVITLDTAGRYLLTNENLRFANINWTFFIAGGAVLVVIAVAYIAFKKRYWFW
mgnify:CR=1 FL=1